MVSQPNETAIHSVIYVSHANRTFAKQFYNLLTYLGGKIVQEKDLFHLRIDCNQTNQLKIYLETLEHFKKFECNFSFKVTHTIQPHQKTDSSPKLVPSHIPNKATRKRPSVDVISNKVIDQDAIYQLKLNQRSETTLMLRNIPNKYTPSMLREFIDRTHNLQYDFFYLRMDFKNKCNVGYAFINFNSPNSLATFAELVQNKRWERFNSEKVIATCFADIQGIDCLIQKFRNSRYFELISVMLENEEYQPQLFYTTGPMKGQRREFPKPEFGKFRPKVDVLFSR